MERLMVKSNSTLRAGKLRTGLLSMLLVLAVVTTIHAQEPTFSKVFAPDTIGSGSVSTITFTITNGSATPVTGLAFTDTLPAAVTIADPAAASTDCDLGLSGSLSAPDGGSTISLSGAQLGGGETCTITVDVMSSTPGSHTNTSGALTSSAGSSGTASDDLIVTITLPGFSKSFAPSTVPLGGRSTLTFTIDNALNASPVGSLDFTDNLPTGMLVADPANASTDCISAGLPDTTITAAPGTSVITLDANGTTIVAGFEVLPIGATCTVTVDVIGTGTGMLDNVSDNLLADFVFAGKASATLDVTVTDLAIQKSFADDPVPPGGTVTLDFTLDNFDRNFSATGIAFTDDLTTLVPALAGLTFDSLLSNDCGGSVSGVGGTTIALTGGTVASQSFCTVSTSLTVPAGATPGAYTNTTSAITGTVDGSPVIGNMASADLFVAPVPLLTKLFVGDPVGAGDTVTLRFTITNTSATSGATDVEFVDELTDGSSGFPADPTSGFLPFPVQVTLPPVPDPPCGVGSSLALISVDTDRQGLSLTGGSLAAAGMAGDSCTFDVTLTIPVGFPAGTYVNTTEEMTATVDGATRTGRPASDDLVVVGAPTLLKAFTDDPVDPGGTVTLEFTLTHDAFAPGDATAIAFSDNLDAALTGLTAIGLPITDVCGTGSQLSGTTNLTFAGGSLAPGESCTFSATLQVPAVAPAGSHTNTTSSVTAMVAGRTATENPAADDLKIAGLSLSKSFTNDPVLPGGTVTLEFTIANTSPISDATAISFSDNLNAALAGLVAIGLPPNDFCGLGSSITGTSFLTFAGGNLLAGESCTFSVMLQVPAVAASGTYTNAASQITATIDAATVIFDNAADVLTVSSDRLMLTKTFTDGPIAPGGTVTLEFTLNNLDGAQSATGIAFTDNLDAALAGLVAIGLPASACGGTLSGTSTLTFTGGSLGPGASCTFSVTLQIPAGLSFGTTATNTTSQVTGMLGGLNITGDPASDDLQIDFLTFTKAFDSLTFAGGAPMLALTIQNLNATGVNDISFTDDLDAVVSGLVATGLPLNDICGTGSQLAGTSFLTLTGGNLGPSGSCTINVPLQVPPAALPGSFTNTTSDLFLAGISVSIPATATLTVEPPPSFSKSFTPTSIAFRGASTVSFTIDNTASALAASNLDFTDNFPAGMVIATPSNASTTCTGGTLTAAAGASVLTYTGGTVAAGTSCTLTVDVTSSAVGMQINTTGDLTSLLGNSGTATDTLDVIPASIVTSLQEGDKIAGSAVALAAFDAPLNAVEVLFQYRPLGTTDWVDIGTAIIPPFFIVTWNTLVVPDGIVELRAQPKLDDGTTQTTAPIQVTFDNSGTASDIAVFGDESGLTAMVSASEDNTVVTSQGVIIEIPAGTLDADGTIIVNVIQPQDASGTPPGDPAALLVDITLASGQDTFANPLTIRMAYADEDQDGVVDGTSIDENTLTLWFFDGDTESWVTVMGAVVRPDANVVEGTVTHLTEFGLFAAPLPGTTLQVTVGAASPEPDVRVIMTRVSRAVPVLQVQLDPEAETCRLTNATLVFTSPRGKAKIAEEFLVDLLNDANGDGVADPDEEVLATAEIMDIQEVLSLTLDPPLALTPGTTVHLLFTLTGPKALTALTQQSVLQIPQGFLSLLGLVVGASTVLGLCMAWRRRRGFSALLTVCMLGWGLILTSCDGDGSDAVTFTVTLPANGLQCERDIAGPFTVPDVPLVGAKVTMLR